MPKRCVGFSVKSAVRPSGAPYWLVRGTLAGRQLTREFSDRNEALGWAAQQNSVLRGVPAERAPVITHLTPDQVRTAAAVLDQMRNEVGPELALQDVWNYYRDYAPLLSSADAPRLHTTLALLKEKFPDVTPSQACEWFVSHYRVPTSSVTLDVALENYLSDVLRRYQKNTLSRRQYLSVGRELARLEGHFGPKTPLDLLTDTALKEYLTKTLGDNYSNKTWNNRRGCLATFFEYCRLHEKWLKENPAQSLRSYKRRELPVKRKEILHCEQVRTLMKAVEALEDGRLVPYFVLTTFCGLRPDWQDGEMFRLRAENVKLSEGKIKMWADQTKPRKPRDVVLQPNVIEWLKLYPLDKYPLRAVNQRKLLKQLRVKFKLSHDVLRHTYCSMLVGKFRSVGDAALQAGNSESVLWADYLNLVDREEAEAFWEIRPTLAAPGAPAASRRPGILRKSQPAKTE